MGSGTSYFEVLLLYPRGVIHGGRSRRGAALQLHGGGTVAEGV